MTKDTTPPQSQLLVDEREYGNLQNDLAETQRALGEAVLTGQRLYRDATRLAGQLQQCTCGAGGNQSDATTATQKMPAPQPPRAARRKAKK